MAEIWYIDFTHKYKIIQGVMVGWSPSLGRSPSNYRTTFRALLSIVGGWDLVCWFYSQMQDHPRCYGRMVTIPRTVTTQLLLFLQFSFYVFHFSFSFFPFPFSFFFMHDGDHPRDGEHPDDHPYSPDHSGNHTGSPDHLYWPSIKVSSTYISTYIHIHKILTLWQP